MNKSNSKHIKDSPKLTNKNTPQDDAQGDSLTDVNIVWGGPKGVHSFRCSDKLWKAFVSEIRARGDSVCHYMETIIAAVLGIFKDNVYNRDTIRIENLSVQRVVKRHRRISHEILPEENCYDPRRGWFFVENADLNENNNAEGCMCLYCAPPRRRRSIFPRKLLKEMR